MQIRSQPKPAGPIASNSGASQPFCQPLRRRVALGLAFVAGLLCCLTAAAGAESTTASEHQIKAAFLYNFAKFIEWPAGRFKDTNAALVIGVTSKSAVGVALQAVVKDRKINGRPIVIKSVETAEAARGTHLLFVGASEDRQVGDLLSALAGSAILTVGESDAFARGGGVINFVLEGDKCRFDINMDAAEKAGLKVSAQLQKLARTVRKKP